jgi:hypothetical protein
MLRQAALSSSAAPAPADAAAAADGELAGIIHAFGMYWARDQVVWTPPVKVLGQQQQGAASVGFAAQAGVYLLYDGRHVVYAGRADQRLGARLFEHTRDRLNGRWDRFSWFGLLKVSEDGTLLPATSVTTTQELQIATLEALLIEVLEPPQNRKRGDDFRAVEYLQVLDPRLRERQLKALLGELQDKLQG